MEFLQVTSLDKRKSANLLVLPFFKDKNVKPAFSDTELKPFFAAPIEMKDFQGKESEILFIYPSKEVEKRCALLGLGEQEKVTVERLRRCFSGISKACQKSKFSQINLVLPHIPDLADEEVVRGVVEGLLLPNYQFNQLKGEEKKEDKPELLAKVCLISPSKSVLEIARKYQTICEGVYFARDLVNGNADDVDAPTSCKSALELAKTHPTRLNHNF